MTTPLLSSQEILVTTAALASGILITRFLPFALFSRADKIPATLLYLGGALPHACMALLLVYCLRNAQPLRPPFAMPEAVALAVTALLHLWRKNPLISIAAGTITYMALAQGLHSLLLRHFFE